MEEKDFVKKKKNFQKEQGDIWKKETQRHLKEKILGTMK